MKCHKCGINGHVQSKCRIRERNLVEDYTYNITGNKKFRINYDQVRGFEATQRKENI